MLLCGVVPADVPLERCAVEEHGAAGSEAVRLSYGELLAHAARLTDLVPAGCSVGVLCEGAAFVVSMFALARSGRVSVPLSPHDPPARLRAILEDAGARAALIHGEALDLREALSKLQLIEALGEAGGSPKEHQAKEADLCYVVYTSGSTGKPKGVAVEHQHLRMYCDAANVCDGLDSTSRMLVATAVNWDPCLSDVARTLLVGGTLVFLERDRLFHDLQGELTQLQISHVFATPSWWSLLEGPVDIAGISAGEPFRPQLAELVPRVVNMYGVTEATVCQTVGPPGGSSHAGWTLDPRAVRVELSAEGERAGEIVMVGPMVARGYWGGRDFNGAFSTGDRGRFDDNGALHVLGRLDHQVKVRGHRIELGEVEAGLRQLAGVRDAVAVLHGHSLVACCEPDSDEPLDGWTPAPASWAAELARSLPAAFRPAPLLSGRLPRLENGKTDRRSVAAAVALALDGRSRAGGPPRPGTERLVAELWSAVLPHGGGALGRDDSWFALGGTSLVAVQMLRLLPAALADAGLCVDRGVAWCGLHRHPSLHAYAAFLDWAASAPEAALADPEQLDGAGDPLVAAAGRGDTEACRELLRDASPNGPWEPSHPCETPLHAAARRGELATVELLLEHGAKVTAGTKAQVLPLHGAAQHGHLAVIDRLVQAGAPLDARDWNRWPALFFAIVGLSAAVADFLIARGCQVNGKDRWGRTPLSWACEKGADTVVQRLIDAKATLGSRLLARQAEKWHADWRPEVHHAVAHPLCLALLLEARASLSCDLQGRSLLHAAVAARNLESTTMLLQAGCLPDVSVLSLADGDARFNFLAEAARPVVATQKLSRSEVLLFGIPAWQPGEVKRAVHRACGRGRVRVTSSGQAGVCLGTAFVEANVQGSALVLRGDSGEVEVGVAKTSGQEVADQAFPRAPVSVRSALHLTGKLPPRIAELASCLAALAAGLCPAADGWTWSEWASWAPVGIIALVDPGALGLQLIYEGVPVEVRCADDTWRRDADLLRTWRAALDLDRPEPASALGASCTSTLIAGSASAADSLASDVFAALLWATEWPWPEAEVELPCPEGVLLIRPGAAGKRGSELASAWHMAQPWRDSRTARKIWRGGAMGNA